MAHQEVLFAALFRWNFWGQKPVPKLNPRKVLSQILPYIDEPNPVVLTGIRRSGKSSLLYLIMQHLLSSGVARNQFLFINFEEPVFYPDLTLSLLDRLVEMYREKINPKERIYFFLDEVQNLPNWEKWVRREADLKEHKIFLTGSSAKLMSSEIASLLTGRHQSFTVYPLDFREFLNWREIRYGSSIEQVENKAPIRNAFLEFIEWGGFPEVTLTQNNEKREKILHQYFDDILYKDIVMRYQIRDTVLLQAIAEQYMTQMASLSSFNRIANILRTSVENVRRYTGFLMEAQLIQLLPKFSYKTSVRITANRKVYVADTGMRNVMTFRFSKDLGRSVENMVFRELSRRAPHKLFYYGNTRECDFLVKDAQAWLPIQVCYGDLNNEKTRTRELDGLRAAMLELDITKGLLLTDNMEGEQGDNRARIQLLPIWKFLL